MAISMYNASVPVFKQLLDSLSNILQLADGHVSDNNIEAQDLLQASLFADMLKTNRHWISERNNNSLRL